MTLTHWFALLAGMLRCPTLTPIKTARWNECRYDHPLHVAVQVEDYQMIPLLKALAMPRISLFIADDVGLGKTVEAGLILSELLLRRRIQRVLILTPASLRTQWKQEMWNRFSLPFDVVDRDSTQKLRRSVGIDANPWRAHSRIISSYYYLRQHDVLEQFRSACRMPDGAATLPWDLLIVDEVHNLMPAPFGEDSDLCKMLKQIAPFFEHRLFLTATPHNGHTRCFSGLLEMLDPVRFTRKDELTEIEKERIRQVVIRRLKREINLRTDPSRFAKRLEPLALVLNFGDRGLELELLAAFARFRKKVRSVVGFESKKRRVAGTFAIEILGKRLLSGPMTFADSWRRCKLGLREDEAATESEVIAAQTAVLEETDDDSEFEQRQSTAAVIIGSWLKSFAEDVAAEIADIDDALARLGVDLTGDTVIDQDPQEDARFDSLCELIDERLREKKNWRDDERLIVFTEYKTTLDYLVRRLNRRYPGSMDRIATLFGDMDERQREPIKRAFNDPASPVRLLVATDAASEGLNLQETARYLLHYDCPWNPSRLEQRNGRLDRHGQARDVQIFHFASEQDADLKFTSYLIRKVDQIREDLGAVSELLDEATHRCLIDGEDPNAVERETDARVERARNNAAIEADDTIAEPEREAAARLTALEEELDLDAGTKRETLDTAMSVLAGRPQLSPFDERLRCKILKPDLGGWSDTIDETVRRPISGSSVGPVPFLAFGPEPFIETNHGRPIFKLRDDTEFIHLGHPLMTRALTTLTRRRFPGQQAVSRWTVRRGAVPAGADAVIVLHLEELAVNELRETFHHWIRTVQIPVQSGRLLEALPHVPAKRLRCERPLLDPALVERARDVLIDVEPDLRQFIKQLRADLTTSLASQLQADQEQAHADEAARYRSRQGEVSTLITEQTIESLERDIVRLKRQRQQGLLFEQEQALADLERSIESKREELERRRHHYEEVVEQLSRERDRILNRVIPRRFAMQGEAQVFPVAMEIWLS